MVFTKADLRASLLHDLSTAVPQAPTPEIEAAATTALASIPSDASLSTREVERIISKAVRELRAAPISFGTPKPNVVVETTMKADAVTRRTFRITRAT
jgi:hypothetical protein